MFKKPTIVTLTAPTCAGKSYFLEVLAKKGFSRIVGTTDRSPREGEIEGVHYYFISTEQSVLKEKHNLFAECVTYNGTRYGITHEEIERQLATGKPPVVIVEPLGAVHFAKYCKEHDIDLFSVFIETAEPLRLERLAIRTTDDIVKKLEDSKTDPDSMRVVILKEVEKNNSRLVAVLEQERYWPVLQRWNCVVDGSKHSEIMLQQLHQAIDVFNQRS